MILDVVRPIGDYALTFDFDEKLNNVKTQANVDDVEVLLSFPVFVEASLQCKEADRLPEQFDNDRVAPR